jgi:hypothetical protein
MAWAWAESVEDTAPSTTFIGAQFLDGNKTADIARGGITGAPS